MSGGQGDQWRGCAGHAFGSVQVQIGELVLHCGTDQQRAAGSWRLLDQAHVRGYRFLQRATRGAADDQVFADEVGDVGVVPAGGHIQRGQRTTGGGGSFDEQAVDRVVEQDVAADIWADAGIVGSEAAGELVARFGEARLFKAVRIGRDGRIGAEADGVVEQCGAALGHLDRTDGRAGSGDGDLATTVANIRVRHEVQEDAIAFVAAKTFAAVDVFMEVQPAPIARAGCGAERVGVLALGLVAIAGEVDGLLRRAQHLQSGQAVVDRGVEAACSNARALQFENGTGVDHHRHAARHLQIQTIGEDLIAHAAAANFIGGTVVRRAGTAQHADDVAWQQQAGWPFAQVQRVERLSWRAEGGPGLRATKALVDEDGLGLSSGCHAHGSGRAEPKIEIAASDPVAVAVDRCAGGVFDRELEGRD